MNIEHGVLMAVFGISMILMQIFCADYDDFLTVKQMQKRGFEKGLPLMWHAGIWGDVFPLTPLLVYLVTVYSNQWRTINVMWALLIGVVAIIGMGFMWVNGAKKGLPEAHTHDGRITGAGFFHAIYFVVAIAVIILTFFCSAISQKAAIVTAIILGVHIVYGTHIVLGLIAPVWYTDRPHKNPATWATILVCWGFLVWRCMTI